MSKIRIASVGTAVPKNTYYQDEVADILGYSGKGREIFLNCGVSKRHFALKKGSVVLNEKQDEIIKRYEQAAVELGIRAINKALGNSKLSPKDIDFLITTSCTGYLCPSLSFRYIKELGFKDSVTAVDLQGMGCGAALPAIKQAYSHILNNPKGKALVVCVEICSASFYFDNEMETLVANAIFSDGAGAAIIENSGSNGPVILDFEAALNPHQLDKLGFSLKDGKLRIVLTKDMKELITPLIIKAIDKILKRTKLSTGGIRHWIVHPGGKSILDGLQEFYNLKDGQIKYSRLILKEFGNMSSASIMFVLEKVLGDGVGKNDIGIIITMGPGLAAYASLVKWL